MDASRLGGMVPSGNSRAHSPASGRNPTFKLFEQNSACALAPADILSSRGRGFMGENDPVADLGVRPVRRGKGGLF
jgi:hypothetical protein